MRLVIDARESGTSTGRYVDKLVEYLHKLTPEFEVILLAKTPRVSYLKQVAPDFRVVESNYKEFTFGEQLGFLRQLWKLKADLVHFSMTQQPVLYPKKTVTTVHDLTTARFFNPAKNWTVFKLKQWVYRGVIWAVAHKSKSIITPSEYVRQDLAFYARIKRSKVIVTHEAADKISAEPEAMGELEGKHFLLYVGRAQPHKNLKRLIEAFREVKWTYPDLTLVLAGKSDPSYRQLENYVKKKKVADVVFTDFVSEGQLRWLYEHAQAYVFPSLSEGFGLPGLEAMQYGLPVISSGATCLPEIYKDGALYFDPKSTKDMAEKIISVLGDEKLSQKLSKSGKDVASGYSWQKMSEETLSVYKEILD